MDDTELALLCWPERVAEICLGEPQFAQRLRHNLPAKLTLAARKRWTADLVKTGCPALADALRVTLDDDAPFDRVVAEQSAGRRD